MLTVPMCLPVLLCSIFLVVSKGGNRVWSRMEKPLWKQGPGLTSKLKSAAT
jgi:hypothetical protein